MAHEAQPFIQGGPVEARSRDDLRQEGSLGHPAQRPGGPGMPEGMEPGWIELRSVLAASLHPSAFPGDRQSLLEAARDEHAPEAVMRLLDRLPDGRWEHLEQVWEAVGGPTERRP
jgi:hypothetical protein